MGLELLIKVPNTNYKLPQESLIPGNPVELVAIWTTGEGKGAALEPSKVAFSLLPPEGTKETPSATKKASGEWSYSFTPEKQGRWWFRWFGEGVSAGEGSFYVATERV